MLNKNLILTTILFMSILSLSNPSATHPISNKTPNYYLKTTNANPNTFALPNPAEIVVPDDYEKIQQAINNASDGDTIFVRKGTYPERIVVNKTVTLLGENKNNTIINGVGEEPVVYITANNITLKNFTIQNGGLGIWLWHSNHNTITSNIFSYTTYGIFLSSSSNNLLTKNTVQNSEYGFFLSSSSNNTFTSNNLSTSSQAIYLWRSDTNTFASNIVSNNYYGFFLSSSSNNFLTKNTAQNNTHAIKLDDSDHNTITYNNISSNDDGIRLYHSSNNILTGNIASNNRYGIYVGDSDTNILSSNIASNNEYGMYLDYSHNNIITANNFTNSVRHGIHLTSSNNNAIFQNNFIDNVEQAKNIYSINSWDNGAEGNYWNDYLGVDADKDGLGDTPYPIDRNNQDNHPLMARFLQLNIATQSQFYKLLIVSNSIISNLRYGYDPNTKTNTIVFEARAHSNTENTSFCRISVPHALIKSPYAVTTDNNTPLHFKTLYSNKTHTWLYFAYYHPQQEITITHMPYPEQLLLFQWAIFGLTLTIIILLAITINYHRKFKAQKKIIKTYERELGSLPLSHPERARERFTRDVIKRKEKIERFRKKYGIKIQPAPTLEDLMEKLGVQKKKVKR